MDNSTSVDSASTSSHTFPKWVICKVIFSLTLLRRIRDMDGRHSCHIKHPHTTFSSFTCTDRHIRQRSVTADWRRTTRLDQSHHLHHLHENCHIFSVCIRENAVLLSSLFVMFNRQACTGGPPLSETTLCPLHSFLREKKCATLQRQKSNGKHQRNGTY